MDKHSTSHLFLWLSWVHWVFCWLAARNVVLRTSSISSTWKPVKGCRIWGCPHRSVEIRICSLFGSLYESYAQCHLRSMILQNWGNCPYHKEGRAATAKTLSRNMPFSTSGPQHPLVAFSIWTPAGLSAVSLECLHYYMATPLWLRLGTKRKRIWLAH